MTGLASCHPETRSAEGLVARAARPRASRPSVAARERAAQWPVPHAYQAFCAWQPALLSFAYPVPRSPLSFPIRPLTGRGSRASILAEEAVADSNPEARISRIILYPVKALDGVDVAAGVLLPSGSLEHDREFVLLDPEGRPVNGKRYACVHRLRAAFDPGVTRVTLRAEGAGEAEFALRGQEPELEAWLSRFFGFPVRWLRVEGGSPDDTKAHGPTVVSLATLREVASWFEGLDENQVVRRFRANLLLDGCPPFWEDRLVGPEGTAVRFAAGEAQLLGVNPCRRCVVPTRDPFTGEPTASFPKVFAERRRAALPPWAESSRFDTTYRLAVNTAVDSAQAGRAIRRGDGVRVTGREPFPLPGSVDPELVL